MTSRWKHDYSYLHFKGKTRVICNPCGKASRWFDHDEHEQMVAWVNHHSGLKERGPKVAS